MRLIAAIPLVAALLLVVVIAAVITKVSVYGQEGLASPDFTCAPANSVTELRLSWHAVPDADYYKVYHWPVWASVDYSKGNLATTTATSTKITGLNAGTRYRVYMHSVDTNNTATTTDDVISPAAARHNCATKAYSILERARITTLNADGTTATIGWSADTRATNFTLEVRKAPPSGVLEPLIPLPASCTNATTTSCVVEGLEPGIRYGALVVSKAAGYLDRRGWFRAFRTLEDDHYRVSLSVSTSTVFEGGRGTITLRADPAVANSPLAIRVWSECGDYYRPPSESDDCPYVPHEVVIPVGQTGASFDFTTRRDADADDDGVAIRFRSGRVFQHDWTPAYITLRVADNWTPPPPTPTPEVVATATPVDASDSLRAQIDALQRALDNLRALLETLFR